MAPELTKKVRGQTGEIVLHIFNKIKQRYEDAGKSEPMTKSLVDTAQMTGVSRARIARIVRQSRDRDRLSASSPSSLSSSSSKRIAHFHKQITGLDSKQIVTIKGIIYDYHKTEGLNIPIKTITARVNKELEINLSEQSMRRILKSIGFVYQKAQDKKKILIEKNDTRLYRIEYIKNVIQHRENGCNIVYIMDERYYVRSNQQETINDNGNSPNSTAVVLQRKKPFRFRIAHAGSVNGFITDALLIFRSDYKTGDFFDYMCYTNISKWLMEQVFPYLEENSIVIIKDAPYHDKHIDKDSICISSTKDEMQQWLREHNIDFNNENMYKAQYYELIKKHREPRKYKLDNLIRSYGHQVLRLPPHHPTLSPIDKIWNFVKERIAERNISFKLEDTIKKITIEEFQKITIQDWRKACYSVIKTENEYLRYEELLDNLTEKIIFACSDAGSSNDESHGDESGEEDNNDCEPVQGTNPCIYSTVIIKEEENIV